MLFRKVRLYFLVIPLLILSTPCLAAQSSATVNYQAHVENVGWMDSVKNNEVAGTTGQNRAIEAIRIEADLSSGSSIEYQSHVSNVGWESDWAKDGEVSGTTGQAKAIEAIRIQLTGIDAQIYDVYYRSHVSDVGWLDWACNGQESGSTGLARKLQAIQIIIVDKGSEAPGATTRPFVSKGMTPINTAETHIGNVGWVESPFVGTMIGTTGQGNKIEALRLTYLDEGKSGIEYKMHLSGTGWESDWKSDGEQSGTTGQGRQAEAIQIRLTGYAAQHYDIYYQAHISDFGWLNWAKNGESAGSEKCAKGLEALNVTVVPKGSDPPGATEEPFRCPITEGAFRLRLKGAWLDKTRAEQPVQSYVAGFSDYYMFAGFNQTFKGVEGYYEVLSANTFGGRIRIVDQKTEEPVELYISFKDLPADELAITQNGQTRQLELGDTTDGVHYSFPGLKQYGQLAIVEIKSKPG